MRAPLAVLLLGFVGCLGSPSYRYTVTAARAPSPRPASCDFRVTATAPREGYEEIGVLEPRVATTQLATFKKVVAPQVCRAGGDLVATEVNNSAFIVRGVVFRHVNAPPRP